MNWITHFFSTLGLQSKFILLTTSAIIMVMSLVGYVAVAREKSILYAALEKDGRLLGETLAIPIINDLIYERLGLVEEGGLLDNYILEIFNRKDIDLLYIAILDEDGKVISHNDISQYGKEYVYSTSLAAGAFDSDNTVVQRYGVKDHDVLDFGIPLSIGKKRWGTLAFGVSLEKADREIITTIRRIITLTMALVISGFAIILLLSRRFISPIIQLANTMERAGGDYLDLKVEIKGHDELAVLGERFNNMLERIVQANAELKKTHEKLLQSEKLASIGILAAGVAHEINNPLGGIFNCIDILRQNDNDLELREKYLDLVREGLERIETTVNKLLWMSRKANHAPDNLNIRDMVEGVYSFLEYKMNKAKIIFRNEVPDDLRLTFDPHDFGQLVLNLFINAIQAMNAGGVIEVRGGKENGTVRIEVIDSGCGIETENIGRIFDPFFTTKPPGEGTGLGLWLTYEIVRNYNGEIFVESEKAIGSRFIMKFPMERA
jgi:signal transduction histidine kinase